MKKALPLALFVSLLLCPAAAFAGVSGWADNTGGRMRIAILPPAADGTRRGVVEIEPAPGWITYWREPGEAGMPPQIEIAPENGLALKSLRFPAPEIFEQNGVRDIGYDRPVGLVFTLDGKAGGTLDATVFIGVCKEICVPFQAGFTVPLTGGETEAAAILAQAESRLPEAPSPGFSADSPKIGPQAKSVSVAVTLPGPAQEAHFYLTGPEGYVYLDPALTPAEGGKTQALFTLGELPKGYDFHGKSWNLLVVSGERAMETPLVFD